MSKRGREEEETSRPPKRSKPEYQPPAVQEIHYARDLQQILSFRQDGLQQLRSGIASFKAFLEAILYRKEEDNRGRLLSILREYLDSQKPKDNSDDSTPFLAQLWQAWSFASQNNNDQITSSVSAIFALLLRTLSSLLDFRDYGILLGRTVLQHQHLRLVKRGLDAPKTKEFVISPCLRLLTELVSFDGGALAKEAYKRREQTFDIGSLRRNLALYKADISDEEAKRKPAVRTLAVRYVLTQLKYLPPAGRLDVLKSRPLCISLLHHLSHDPAEMVNEILNVTEQYVLKDEDLPRSAKATLLTQHNLERVTEVASRSDDEHSAADRAFAWLEAVVSDPSYGVMRESGWYPANTTTRSVGGERYGAIDLGLDSLEFFDANDRPDIRNSALLEWLLTLRPHSSARERSLVLSAFAAAPELVAAYLADKPMQLDPKLTNTWIGYASFLFEVADLPVPPYLGNTEHDDSADGKHQYADLPPQTNIVLDNILPRPLTKKVLTRCLNQGSELITFFAVRILVLAFLKAQTVLNQLKEAAAIAPAESSSLWDQAIERFVASFSQRAPIMKDIVTIFRRLPDDEDHVLQREATTRLLSLYLDVLPLQALEAPFDISTALSAALSRGSIAGGAVEATRMLEMQHLLSIAQHATGMKWFTKQGGLTYSPLVSLLRQHIKHTADRQQRSLIATILRDNLLTVSDTESISLIASLLDIVDDEVWSFIDDCLSRVARQPVKYIDLRDQTAGDVAAENNSGLFMVAVDEQTSFAHDKKNVLRWIDTYKLLLNKQEPSDLLQPVTLPESSPAEQVSTDQGGTQVDSLPFAAPKLEPDAGESRSELVRWHRKDLSLASDDGDIAALISCISSQHEDVRDQAYAQLRILRDRLKAQKESRQQFVVIGSLVETYERQCLPQKRAMPYLTSTFAARALAVAEEPVHSMYTKVNKYLMKGPEWRMSHMATYWLDNTLHAEPTEDDAYWREVKWVLEWLVDGLRSNSDLDLLRRQGVFEEVMAIHSSPGAERMKGLRKTILELVYRATCVPGGSEVLLTRTGIISWLAMVRQKESDVPGLLRQRILQDCDSARLKEWSAVEKVL